MIEINKPEDCCGCTACEAVCPVDCISMTKDNDGFAYAHVDKTQCIDCGLCLKACPVISRYGSAAITAKVYAAINCDTTVRAESSSGGVFSLLAQAVLGRNGVVFGARYDNNFKVVHGSIEHLEDLHLLRGSKYAQSDMGESLSDVKRLLTAGREVLFSGTPCQVAGLKHFLHQDYPLLITVDVACHGVPSPAIFERYLSEQKQRVERANKGVRVELKNFTFRNKEAGWRHYNVVSMYNIVSGEEGLQNKRIKITQPFFRNEFMRGFLHNLFLRPICYQCPSKKFTSGSDITIADYWGIENCAPQMDDDKGTSLVIVLTSRGQRMWDSIASGIKAQPTKMADALSGNHALVSSENIPAHKELFFADLSRMTLAKAVEKHTKTPVSKKIKRTIIKIAKLFGITIKRR